MRIIVGFIVVSAIGVEDYLTLPRLHITHFKAAFLKCIETAVGKGTAPVLVNMNSNYILLAANADKVLLLLGQLVNLVVVPTVLVTGSFRKGIARLFINNIIIVVNVITCCLPDKHTVDVVLGRSIVVTASQINITGKHVVCGEGTANVDVGDNAAACPLERLHALPVFVTAERSLLLFPLEAVFCYTIVVFCNGRFVVILLIPEFSVGIRRRTVFQDKHVIVNIHVVPFSILLADSSNENLCFVRLIAPPCRLKNGDVCTHRGNSLGICSKCH